MVYRARRKNNEKDMVVPLKISELAWVFKKDVMRTISSVPYYIEVYSKPTKSNILWSASYEKNKEE
jgi:hypothetical protein